MQYYGNMSIIPQHVSKRGVVYRAPSSVVVFRAVILLFHVSSRFLLQITLFNCYECCQCTIKIKVFLLYE